MQVKAIGCIQLNGFQIVTEKNFELSYNSPMVRKDARNAVPNIVIGTYGCGYNAAMLQLQAAHKVKVRRDIWDNKIYLLQTIIESGAVNILGTLSITSQAIQKIANITEYSFKHTAANSIANT